MSEYDAAAIEEYLTADYAVEFHELIDSTNQRARTLADEGKTNVVVVAGEQTVGRGRLDREWASPEGGVWLSILRDPDLPAADTPLLTLAAGVATARAVRETGVPARIKWPNDVLVSFDEDGDPVGPDAGADVPATTERKLAGILVERHAGRVVVGVGLNANLDAADLPEGATTLRDLVGDVDRAALVARIVESFDELLADPDEILPTWRNLSSTLGRQVRVETPTETVVGEAVDVERPGSLVLETAGGRRRVSVGDCEHLRPAE